MQKDQKADKCQVTFRVPSDLRKRITESAHIMRTTKNQFVIDALDSATSAIIKGVKL